MTVPFGSAVGENEGENVGCVDGEEEGNFVGLVLGLLVAGLNDGKFVVGEVEG